MNRILSTLSAVVLIAGLSGCQSTGCGCASDCFGCQDCAACETCESGCDCESACDCDACQGGHGGKLGAGKHLGGKLAGKIANHRNQHLARQAARQNPGPYAAGPPSAGVTYPYYTTRGPRDFLAKNPRGIGP